MKKAKKIHQKIRSAFLSGVVLQEVERCAVFDAIEEVDKNIEQLLLNIELGLSDANPVDLGFLTHQVIELQQQHLILSDLNFSLKNSALNGRN